MENELKKRIVAGHRPTQVFVTSGSTWVAHRVAQLGFDSVLIDLQLGPATIDRLGDLVMAVGHDHSPFVRVGSSERGVIEKAVEVGVHGVVCPSVDTATDAATLVDACANSKVTECLPVVQIESVTGYQNLEEICATPGLFAIEPGPKDLRAAFGGPPRIDFTDESLVRRLRRIVDVAHAHGLYVTVPSADPEQFATALAWGSDYATMPAFDMSWITTGAAATLAMANQALGRAPAAVV